MKILIVGAGVAGLATGWQLAQAGASVEIVERGLAGRGATWAAAGMLAPGVEASEAKQAFIALSRVSRLAWPSLAAGLEEETGHAIGFRECGSLVLAFDEAHAATLEAKAKALRKDGVAAQWLTTHEVRTKEPLVRQDIAGALQVATDAQVDNRALGAALAAAFVKNQGVLRERCEVRSLIVEKDRVRGIVTDEGTIAGDCVILASGAWLNGVSGIRADALPSISPIKGQMIALEPPDGATLPKALLWSDEVYLVPRHRRLIAGATVEDAGFDMSVTREAVEWLHASARTVIPAAQEWKIAEAWAGLRPRAPDGMPVLGATEIEGLFVAGGQFRNGILFAPLVASILKRAVLEQGRDNPFLPTRFRASSA